MTRARVRAGRAEGPRGAQPLLPARRDQAHPGRHRSGAGPGGGPAPAGRAARDRLDPCRRPAERLPPALADPAADQARTPHRRRGGHHPARRTRAADGAAGAHRGRLPVARPQPGPCAGRGRGLGHRRPRHRRRRHARRGRRPPGRLRRARPGADHHPAARAGRGRDRHQRQDHDLADDRAHRPRGRSPRRLVQHRRHLRRRRARRGRRLLRALRRRPGARAQEGRLRGHRDRPRRHPAQGHRPGQQRRLGGHQRHRRPPRAPGHRHRRPARRGQGRGRQDHQEVRLGGAQRRRPARLRHAYDDPRTPLGLLPRLGLARPARDPLPRRPGDHDHRRLDHRARGQPRRPAHRGRRRPDDPERAVPLQRRERPRRRLGRTGCRHPAPARGGGAALASCRTPSTTRAG